LSPVPSPSVSRTALGMVIWLLLVSVASSMNDSLNQ